MRDSSNGRRRYAVAALVLAAALGLSACGGDDIPTDASKQDFCHAGERFSALQKVPFAEGQEAVEALGEVGTPSDIDAKARSGFTELIERMSTAEDAADFRQRTKSMTEDERDHLFALDTYIQGTCSDRVPAAASEADFCVSGKKFAAAPDDAFAARKAAIIQLAQVGTPESIGAEARLGFIELIDRMNNSQVAIDYQELTRTMSPTEKDYLEALDAYIRKTCS